MENLRVWQDLLIGASFVSGLLVYLLYKVKDRGFFEYFMVTLCTIGLALLVIRVWALEEVAEQMYKKAYMMSEPEVR